MTRSDPLPTDLAAAHTMILAGESGEPVSASNMTFMQARTANEVLKAQERRVRLQRMKGELVDRAKAVRRCSSSPATSGTPGSTGRQADMQAELRDVERAVAAGTRDAGRGLRTELRRQVASAGLGHRLANSWRDRNYPNQKLDAASLVYTKVPQIIRAFDEG